MSLGTQINVAQEFAPHGAPATATAVDPSPTAAAASHLQCNASPPVAPPAAPLQRTVSAPAVGVAAGGPGPQPSQPIPPPVASAAPASTGVLMGPPPPQPQHITVERGCQKKTRLVWTQELHMRFLFAVEKIGLRTAVPRTILQVMQVDGLTRENIASHLQKYRRLLEKKAGISGPVGTKDWPKLETAQTHHLAQLRKQMDSSTAAADAATTAAAAAMPSMAAAATSSGGAPEPAASLPPPHAALHGAAAPAPVVAMTTSPAAAPQQPVPLPVLGPAPQPPQQMAAPVSAAPQAAPAPSAATAPPMWQAQTQAPAQAQAHAHAHAHAQGQVPTQAPAACMPPPATPHQLPQPGICPVTPQEPQQAPIPTSDAEGNTLGVPMPQPIMPPLMCVLPQSDGSPALLPMLPAMYMASYGCNTPDFLGSIPLPRQQVPGMAGPPVHPHPQQYPHSHPHHAHGHAHTHAHAASHHVAPVPMGMYPGSYNYPAAPAPPYQAMPMAQPAGIGSPMLPPSYASQMPMGPVAAPMPHHDTNMHMDMPGMHGGYAWQRPGGWRPPSSKGGGQQSRSTLPPLVADRGLPHQAPSAPPAQGASHMQTRAASGARNGTNGASCSRGMRHSTGDLVGGMDHDAADHDTHGIAGRSTAGRQIRGGNKSATLNRRANSVGVLAGVPVAGSAVEVDWTEDAMANIKLDDGAIHANEVVAALGEIPHADVAAMDLDELGWPAWPEAGNSSGNGDVDLEQGDEVGTGDQDVADAIADIFDREMSPQPKRKTRHSMSASLM